VHAETLLMPDRDFLMGTPEVVWGITTLPNGTAYTLNYGDGSAVQAGNVTDRSYIAFNHTYAISGTFTVTLTVGAESATAKVQVFNQALLSAADLRGLKINKAIEDGCATCGRRSRTGPRSTRTRRRRGTRAIPRVGTSFAVLAFENHNYKLPTTPSPATGSIPSTRSARDELHRRQPDAANAGHPAGGQPLRRDPGGADELHRLVQPGLEPRLRHVHRGAGGAGSSR
jgi:hypothetical protein